MIKSATLIKPIYMSVFSLKERELPNNLFARICIWLNVKIFSYRIFLESDLDPLSFTQQPVLRFAVVSLFSMLFATKEKTEIHEG